MANQEHLDMVLSTEVAFTEDEYNKWKNRDPENHTQLDLSGADFSGKTFDRLWLGYSNLENASFKNAKLKNVRFDFANLAGVNFENAELVNNEFNNVTSITCAIFKGTKFVETNLRHLDLSNLNFANADFSKIEIRDVIFREAHFSGDKNQIAPLGPSSGK